MADKKITRQLSIFINGNEVKNSLGAIGREIGKVKAQLKEANDPEDIRKYKAELDELGKKYGDVKQEIHGTKQTLEDAKGHWDNLLGGILGGDIDAVKSGMAGLKSGIAGVTQSAMAFIATPIGAAIAALAVIGGAAKMWFDYNTEIAKTIKLTEQLTGFSGDELSDFRASVQATASTFDKEFNEVLRSANALSKQMKISQQEALDLINQGLTRGADVGGDFLDKIREYPIQFKNAGFSAQDFIDIATQEAKGGVYNDKLVDTLKEVDLALKEMTKTQRDALQNAFGQTFADEIAKGVKSGEITTKDAIGRIIAESDKLGLNYQQQQQIVADLFKGAGEDAGGLAEIIIQLDEAFKDENKTLNENEAATMRLVEANEANEKALADLFDASQSGFPVMLSNIKSIGLEISTNVLSGLRLMFTSIQDLKAQAGIQGTANAVKDVANNMKDFGTTAADETKYMVDQSIKNVERLKKEVKDSYSILDPLGLFGKGNDLKAQLAKEEAYLSELKTIAEGKSEAFITYQENLKVEPKKILNEDLSQEEKDAQAKIAAELKRKSDAAQKEADAKLNIFQKAEQELNDIIKGQQEERLNNTLSAADKEQALIDQKYAKLKEKFTLSEKEKTELTLEQVAEREDQLAELEAQKAQEKLEAKIERDAAFKEQLDAIAEENRLLDTELQFEREEAAAETEDEKARILLEKTRYIAEMQLDIARDKELAEVGEVENAEMLKSAIREKYTKKKAQVEEEFLKGKKAADKKAVQDEAILTKQRTQAYADMFGNIASLLGENTAAGKAAAIAQATINTWQGVTEVWKAPAVLPEPFNTISKVAASGVTIASGLKAVGVIKSTSTPSFFYGGPTGDKAMYYDQYGKVTGAVHDGEWVAPKMMVENPRYATTLSWLEKERQQMTGKTYFKGGSTSTQTPEFMKNSDTTEVSTGTVLNMLLTVLTQMVEDGVATGPIIIGDDQLQDIKKRTVLIEKARESAKIK